MSFQIRAELGYRLGEPSTLVLALQAARCPGQEIVEEALFTTPGAGCEFLTGDDGRSRFIRLETRNLPELHLTYTAQVRCTPNLVQRDTIADVPIGRLPVEVLPFLFPSRYCPSDLLGDFAHRHFGAIGHPLAQARAIADWLHAELRYEPGSSTTATTALDTLQQRRGVCRDFAHLGISLCRALSIPARYFSGYAWDLDPPDFHACLEVFAGGHWFLFDPTRLSVPDGLVRIGTGRDAADTAIATLFGPVELLYQKVGCTAPDFASRWRELPADTVVRLEPPPSGSGLGSCPQ